MNLLTRFKIALGILCPEHEEETYFDEDYGLMRCSVTDKPVKYEQS